MALRFDPRAPTCQTLCHHALDRYIFRDVARFPGGYPFPEYDDLPLNGQPTPLVVVEQDPLLAKLLSENPILCQKVVDRILMSTTDPAGEDQKEQLPRLQDCLHIFFRLPCESLQQRVSMTACQAVKSRICRLRHSRQIVPVTIIYAWAEYFYQTGFVPTLNVSQVSGNGLLQSGGA